MQRIAMPVLVVLVTLFGCSEEREFELALWQQSATDPDVDDRWPYRAEMIKDLLEHHDFHGLSRSRLVAILGEPDDMDWPEEGDCAYFIHPSGLGQESLVFNFDGRGKVQHYQVVYIGF